MSLIYIYQTLLILKGENMNHNKSRFLLAILSSLTIFSGCAIPGVTVPLKQNSSETETVENGTLDKNDYEPTYLPESKTPYNIGDKVTRYMSPDNNSNYIPCMNFTIKSAKLYNNVSDSGIDTSKLADDYEIYKYLSPNCPELIDKNTYINCKFLLLDIDAEYTDNRIKEDDTGYLSLIYLNDDNSFVSTSSSVAYLSNSNDFDVHYTGYDVNDKNINFQVGYIVDNKLFEADDFDLSRLYICTNEYASQDLTTDTVWLGLNNKEE